MAKSTPLTLDQGYDPTDVNSSPIASPLENAVQAYLLNNNANNPQQDTSGNANGVQTAQIGPFGSHILVKNPDNGWAGQASNFLAGAGQQYLQGQTLQKRQQFIQGVHQIMSSPNQTQQDRMNALLDLQTQHGTDYGIGLNDMASKLGLTKGQAQNTLTPGQRIQSLISGLQTGQTSPDQAHQQALTIDPNYQQTQPDLSGAINQSYTKQLDTMIKSKLGPQYEANPDFISTGKGNPYQIAGVGASNDPNFSSLPPADALKKLQQENPGYSSQLQQIASGQGGKISSSNRSPRSQQMMQDLSFFYPGSNVDNINQKVDTLKDFASGPTSKNIVAFNTALQHLNTLNGLVPKLNNSGSEWFNGVAQPLEAGTGIGNNPSVSSFNTTKTALAGELATAYKNSGATQEEINSIQKDIKSSGNPDNLKASVQSAVTLLNGKLQALQSKWGNTFSNQGDPQGPGGKPIISPASQQIINNLSGEGQGQQGGQVGQYQVGDARNIGGITYIRDANGAWNPKAQ